MRLSYVVLATVLVLAASTEAVVTTTNSVNPAIEDHRFLRVQKNVGTAADEERGLPKAAEIKEKIVKLNLKIAMPGIKKVLAGIVKDLLK
ncbi:hypothetical protein PI125_g7479 [Phytophthora idaei]|nr:hypothetical protein PI125_g7479 [Phytophthora idaei]